MTYNNKTSQENTFLKVKQRTKHAQIHISWPQYCVAEMLVAVSCSHLSDIAYIFWHCNLIVLNKSHEKELQVKNNSFTGCHTEGLIMKAN